jgi:hypothetical protein
MQPVISSIDPKLDIAFKKALGSEPWRDRTAALINAMWEPLPPQRLVDTLVHGTGTILNDEVV